MRYRTKRLLLAVALAVYYLGIATVMICLVYAAFHFVTKYW